MRSHLSGPLIPAGIRKLDGCLMHKAGESIRSVEDVAQSLFKPLTLYLLCARVKPFFAVRWRGWRSAFDGSWGRACGLVDGAHNIIAARKGWDGLARAHSQVATRLGPADLQGGSCGLPLFDCSYGQVCRAGVAAPAFRASQSIEGTIWFSHIFNRLSLHCSKCVCVNILSCVNGYVSCHLF